MSHYYQPDNATEIFEAALGDWLSCLTSISQRAIENACGAYLRDQPRRRPTPGDIRGRALDFDRQQRERFVAALPPPPPAPAVERDVLTADRAQSICEELGFTPELRRAVKRFPMAKTSSEAIEGATVNKEPHWVHSATPEKMEQLAKARAQNAIIQKSKAGVA